MTSMTGFGYAETASERFRLIVETKTYNHRYLDFSANLPGFLSPLEPRVRERASEFFRRGRVEVYIRLQEIAEDLSVTIDEQAVRRYLDALRRLQALAGIKQALTLEHLLSLEGVLKTEHVRDIEVLWSHISPALEQALTQALESRQREGATTEQDILTQLARIGTALATVEARAPELEVRLTETLRSRFEELLDTVDEERLYTEVAVILNKHSINEELSRLRAHIAAFHETRNAGGPVGRKLDFISQEMNREINTIGSKSVLADINAAVVEMKDALENVREQLRNLE